MQYWKITKLDGRHTGHEWFTHSINYSMYVRGHYRTVSENEITFMDHRVWCWENFGPSCELRLFDAVLHRTDEHNLVKTWAWRTDDFKLKLFLTEEAMVFFTLAHST